MTPQIEFVFNQLDDSLKKEIIDFWVGEKALGIEQAHQRVNEIALIARGSESKIMASVPSEIIILNLLEKISGTFERLSAKIIDNMVLQLDY